MAASGIIGCPQGQCRVCQARGRPSTARILDVHVTRQEIKDVSTQRGAVPLPPRLKPTTLCKLRGGKDATLSHCPACKVSARKNPVGKEQAAGTLVLPGEASVPTPRGAVAPMPDPSEPPGSHFCQRLGSSLANVFSLWISALLYQEWTGTVPGPL